MGYNPLPPPPGPALATRIASLELWHSVYDAHGALPDVAACLADNAVLLARRSNPPPAAAPAHAWWLAFCPPDDLAVDDLPQPDRAEAQRLLEDYGGAAVPEFRGKLGSEAIAELIGAYHASGVLPCEQPVGTRYVTVLAPGVPS